MLGIESDVTSGRRRALEWFERALEADPEKPSLSQRILAASLAASGRTDEARATTAELLNRRAARDG